jgi:hypothetical protein
MVADLTDQVETMRKQLTDIAAVVRSVGLHEWDAWDV